MRLHYCVYVIKDFVVLACNIFVFAILFAPFGLYTNNAFITK
ncbi:hypothetical protein HMPREF3230_01150 [Gardnerella vaginalis]|uniref:Uncharacterized protein n=1 Tax=Gardnerella vaginalis TaxID=2702 RepID=A0A135Z3R3_GARVA|nr:hypothetical protein HMPREF3230_01150 [Gardnerella vaginalis]